MTEQEAIERLGCENVMDALNECFREAAEANVVCPVACVKLGEIRWEVSIVGYVEIAFRFPEIADMIAEGSERLGPDALAVVVLHDGNRYPLVTFMPPPVERK